MRGSLAVSLPCNYKLLPPEKFKEGQHSRRIGVIA
jgi:hypothetical protein